MNRRDPAKRKYTRVEHRKDYVEPQDVEVRLDKLESTGDLEGVISPGLISSRLETYYIEFKTVSDRAERKELLTKACNLASPIMHQVIARFKKFADVYPEMRPEIRTECFLVVIDVFHRRRFDTDKNTRMSSFLFELFRYAILGVESRFFRQKKKYVTVDPQVIGKKLDGC